MYHSQLNNLPFSRRKTLSLQTLLSCIHCPRGHSDLLAHFKQMTAHQCFLGILYRLGNRGAEGHTPLPRGSHRTIQIALLMQRTFSLYQVTEFLTPWTICLWEKTPGKKPIRLLHNFSLLSPL